MGELRAPVTIDQVPSGAADAPGDEDVIDLEDWVAEKCGGDDLKQRLLSIAKQMHDDAKALPRSDPQRATLFRDAANVFAKLIDRRDGGKGGLSGATPAKAGGVAVAQISRDDAVGSYMRLIGGDAEGAE